MHKTKVVVATGGFDPIHEGHIYYLTKSKELGDVLLVGLNSDGWLVRKKGTPFMTWDERAAVIKELKCVDSVLSINDADGSGRDAIRQAKELYPDSTIIFANGGDRTAKNIPEIDQSGVEFVFGVGGDWKANSSSDILRRYTEFVKSTYDCEMSSYRRIL